MRRLWIDRHVPEPDVADDVPVHPLVRCGERVAIDRRAATSRDLDKEDAAISGSVAQLDGALSGRPSVSPPGAVSRPSMSPPEPSISTPDTVSVPGSLMVTRTQSVSSATCSVWLCASSRGRSLASSRALSGSNSSMAKRCRLS